MLFGPNVSIFAATHPLDPDIRRGLEGPEAGKPVTIADDCWIAGNVTIFGDIGQGSTIGAGSVVTKVGGIRLGRRSSVLIACRQNIPPYSFAAGNPARVIKRIECPAARRYYGDDFDKQPTGTTSVSGKATDGDALAKA